MFKYSNYYMFMFERNLVNVAQYWICDFTVMYFEGPSSTLSPQKIGRLGAAASSEEKVSPWSYAYYQLLFDVDTDQVLRRITNSIVPTRRGSFYDSEIKKKPDLYGPFWICVTLVFSIAIFGNLYNYFMLPASSVTWHYDFHKVPFAATAIFTYAWLLPTVIYGLLWWREAQGELSFLGLICVYGYSLAIYIPASILWLIPVPWFQWTLVIVAAALSGSVLLLTLWPAVSGSQKRTAIIVIFAVLLFHMALAAGFLLYFFHVPAMPTGPHAYTLQSTLRPDTPTKPVSKRSETVSDLDRPIAQSLISGLIQNEKKIMNKNSSRPGNHLDKSVAELPHSNLTQVETRMNETHKNSDLKGDTSVNVPLVKGVPLVQNLVKNVTISAVSAS
nr:EOG090X0CJ3 [Artemia franciscana]